MSKAREADATLGGSEGGQPSEGTDLLARWLAEEDQGRLVQDEPTQAGRPGGRGSRGRVVIVVAAACTLVAAMLLQQPGAQPPDAPTRPVASPTTPGPERQQLSTDELKAAAVMLVRQALTSPAGDGEATYVDQAVADMVERVGSAEWVVRVQALVLTGDQERWLDQRLQVYVVPVGMRDGQAIGLERPWPVGERALTFTQPGWKATTQDQRAVIAALRDAGYQTSGKIRIETAAELPAIARVTLDASDGPRHVWVRLSEPVEVLGRDRAAYGPAVLTRDA